MSHSSRTVGSVERLPADEGSPWWGEHRSRYRHAQQFVRGCVVLDVACGTGYGALLLAQFGARFVAGCDLTVDEIESQRRLASDERVGFVAGNGTVLPFGNGSFDVVVSFETLEHIADGPGFVRELNRVLRPGGRLLLSTPNAAVTSRYPRNPFHVHEYTLFELDALLRPHFATVEIVGQVLDKRYAVSPFLPGYDTARSWRDHHRLILWKMIRRLPRRWGMAVSRGMLGRELYPSEQHYGFEGDPTTAHVLMAHCRRL